MYTANYFINKFTNTRRSQWCTGATSRGSRKDALGHAGYTDASGHTRESRALANLLGGTNKVRRINDNLWRTKKFVGRTAQRRILRQLRKVRDAGSRA